jgi:prepilin-type N-terminal cleavage/methylation domain-containing protein
VHSDFSKRESWVNRGRAAQARARGATGFTLIELCVVIILIAVLALLALPAMQKAQADRRLFAYAVSAAEVIRDAHARAMARGTPVLVEIVANPPTDLAHVQVYDPVDVQCPPTTQQASCTQTSWKIGTNTTLADGVAMVPASVPLTTGLLGTYFDTNAAASVAITAPGSISAAYLCFSPSGKAYRAVDTAQTALPNFGTGGPFIGFYDMTLQRTAGGVIRHVVVPSNGAARVMSQ